MIFRNKEAGHEAYVDIGRKMAEYINQTVVDHLDAMLADAKAKKDKLTSKNETGRHPPLRHKFVYIAAPPSENKVINSMKQALLLEGVKVFFGEDLEQWFEHNYVGKCDETVLKDQKHDFISLVEMELCAESTLFIYSGGSSWSRNICMERQAQRRAKFDTGNGMFLDWSHGIDREVIDEKIKNQKG